MIGSTRIGLAVVLVALPGVVLAHSPVKGLDDFYAGFLHPILVPGHLLSALVLGLLFGQQGPQRVQVAVIGFLLAVLTGLGLTLLLPAADLGLALLLGAALGGILIAWAARLPVTLCTLLALALGLLVGLDSAQPQLDGRAQLASLLGSGLAVYLLVLYAMVFGDRFSRREWQRIGLRVLGSWGAASALLVLSLSFAR